MSNTSSPVQQTSNRRLSARRAAKRGARIECRKGALGLGKDIAVSFIDLSETGIQLLVSAPLKRGDEVEVKMAALGGRQLKILGQVVWASPGLAEGIHCLGVRFDKRLPYATLLDLTRLPES